MSAGPAITSIVLLILAIISGASFLCFLLSPLIAWRKGYAPYYWLFACGPIGLIVICFLPSVKTATTPEKFEQLQARADMLGGILSGIAIFFGALLMFLAIFGLGL